MKGRYHHKYRGHTPDYSLLTFTACCTSSSSGWPSPPPPSVFIVGNEGFMTESETVLSVSGEGELHLPSHNLGAVNAELDAAKTA